MFQKRKQCLVFEAAAPFHRVIKAYQEICFPEGDADPYLQRGFIEKQLQPEPDDQELAQIAEGTLGDLPKALQEIKKETKCKTEEADVYFAPITLTLSYSVGRQVLLHNEDELDLIEKYLKPVKK